MSDAKGYRIDNGYQLVIIRAHRNIGVVDWQVAETIRSARAAGIPRIEAYFLPCRSCGDPAQQVRRLSLGTASSYRLDRGNNRLSER